MREPKNPVLWMLLCCAIFGTLLTCSEKDMARNWGGTVKVELDPGRKLMNVTWKQTDLWILTREMKAGEEPENYQFTEDADWGSNGKVLIYEQARTK